jgi:hypothetical protein
MMCLRVVGAFSSCIMKYFIECMKIRAVTLAIPDLEMHSNYMTERLWFLRYLTHRLRYIMQHGETINL